MPLPAAAPYPGIVVRCRRTTLPFAAPGSVTADDTISGICPPSRREVTMKKVLILALVAAAVFIGVKKARSGRADADLWAEATDSVNR
jgi:hypothetical protein